MYMYRMQGHIYSNINQSGSATRQARLFRIKQPVKYTSTKPTLKTKRPRSWK